jgi:hypothetical protein
MNWDSCPSCLTTIDLGGNEITEMNWDSCPSCLTTIDLRGNELTEMNWDSCPSCLTTIDLGNNKITQMNWEGCPHGLETIYLGGNKITQMNWDSCRNEFITGLKNPYYSDYLKHKQSKNFIPYLPIVSKEKKELHYALSHIWWSCPNGIRYLEEVQELKENFGMFR